MIVKGVLSDNLVTSMNIYPKLASENSFVGGDFKCHFNFSRDRLPPGTSPPSKHARVPTYICQDIEYADVWQESIPWSQSLSSFLPRTKVTLELISFSFLHQKCLWFCLCVQ